MFKHKWAFSFIYLVGGVTPSGISPFPNLTPNCQVNIFAGINVCSVIAYTEM